MHINDMIPHRRAMFPWLENIPELSPHSFTFEEHELNNGFLWDDTESDIIKLPDGWICLGWADGGAIPVRPRPNMIAVRFADKDGTEFWCHLE